ncbi:MAG: polysaccharide pyruvyl transferase family protein [Symploca sp. SIO1C4]|uniref:Polysaccharide pyruvyl transferase family protein n=1 Tax=Symploca sp. SIO1C4 TaxID=2607765 RepID=A0A6B3NJJ8_9CYAN|nr:polysaccharide pyruvyl transferase family protein [Symploca sp. SIO1C4]
MKLFYYQRRDRATNFGDALNPWLWNQLLPGVFDEDETTAFIGIGTVINNLLPSRVPNAREIVIFSSGVGYEKGIPVIDDTWKIYCLRGPLSTQKLGLDASVAVVDGAILLRRLWQPPESNKVNRWAFMPHIHHANFGNAVWKSICAEIGVDYIDPRWSVEQVLSAINQTEVLLAEAMHGAIAAEALRVPWVPISTSARILPFKWYDWCASIDVEYQPRYVTPMLDVYPAVARGVRSSLVATRHWLNWLQQDRMRSVLKMSGDKQKLMATQLMRIIKTARPVLSSDRKIEQLTVKLEERLDQFKADHDR